jgi:serine/threonine-protein kinase
MAAAAFGTLVTWISIRPPPPGDQTVTRFVVSLPPDHNLGGPGLPFALSPDGRRLVYVAENRATQQLYLRELEDFEAVVLPGTEGASNPFFSPDGQSVGFCADGNLKKISLTGAAVTTLCRAPPLYLTGWGGGGFWGPDDTILFSDDTRGFMRISADGGAPESVTDPQVSEAHLWPQILPDGRSLLSTIFNYTSGTTRLSLLWMETDESRALLPGSANAYQARYLPTGHLVYAQSGGLWATPFDVSRLEPTGSPVSVLDNVRVTPIAVTGRTAYFAVAGMGSLVYVPGRADGKTSLVWVDREGREIPWTEEGNVLYNPRLSPDGTRVAISVTTPEGADIWVYEVDRGTRTRLTFGGFNIEPIWSLDGTRITFSGPTNVQWIPGDGSGTSEILVQVENATPVPSSWSSDGQILAFYEINSNTARDIWALRLDEGGKPTPILATEFNEHSPMFSPDGGWLAYVSDESGREEVYVRPYLGPGAKHPVSSEGGREPAWSADGHELFYRNGDKMMVVTVATEPDFTAGTPRVLFEGPYAMGSGGGNNYDVTPDGQRFLMIRRDFGPAPTQINVVLNWAEELKRLVPTN